MKKISLFIIFNFCFSYCFSQDNPYAIFGYKPKAIFTDSKEDVYRVKNTDTNSEIKFLEIDFEKHEVKLLNAKDSIFQKRILTDDRLLRFLSVDPITKKYPELTPYQFASNSPISGIDRDGLEYYYVGNGTLIGRGLANDTRVMLISNNVTIAQARNMMTAAHSGNNSLDQLNANSKYVGMNNAELNTRAFMSTLRQNENHNEAPLAYNSWNGFKKGKPMVFTNDSYNDDPEAYAHHPGANPDNGKVSAAGAYQIMKASWGKTSKSFSPENQDKWVLNKIFNKEERNAGKEVMSGDVSAMILKLRGEWRSLPGPQTQFHSNTVEKVEELFKKNVSNELNGNSIIALPVGTTLNGVVKP